MEFLMTPYWLGLPVWYWLAYVGGIGVCLLIAAQLRG